MEMRHQMTMIFWHVYGPGVGVLYLDILKMHLIVTFEYNMILLLSDNIAIIVFFGVNIKPNQKIFRPTRVLVE